MNWTEFKRELLRQITITNDTDDNGFNYDSFVNVPDSAKLKDSDIGKKVWVASRPRTKDVFLLEIHDDYFKLRQDGRLKGGEVPISSLYKNEVILHPDEWDKDRMNYE